MMERIFSGRTLFPSFFALLVLCGALELVVSSNSCPYDPNHIVYHLRHNETKQCYLPNTQGPCGALMTIQALPPVYTEGACECQKGDSCAPRKTVFWAKESRCYYIYDQGPCENGEWLEVVRGTPKCKLIPCLHAYELQSRPIEGKEPSNEYLFPYNGQCYKTQTRAFCSHGEKVVLNDNLKPHCVDKGYGCGFPASISGGQLSCPPGYVRDSTNHCSPKADFSR